MASILILGGTAWLGQELAKRALAQGHDVWCLARGESGNVPQGARWVHADRSSADAYREVSQHTFERAIEVSWQPRWVSEAVAALGDNVGHWTHISSVSVYAPHERDVQDESVPLHSPLAHDATAEGDDYSQAKVACEQVFDAAAPGRVLHVRAGVIAGPGDPTDRFGYWPARFALAGDQPVLIPDTPDTPTQNIDVRDLVEWVLHASAQGLTGPVNAVGPVVPFAEMIACAREAAGYSGDPLVVASEWLKGHGVAQWSGPRSLAWWIDGEHKYPAIGRHDGARYRESGGRNRDYLTLMQDVLEDERARGLDRERKTGLTRAHELELIGEAQP